MSPPDTIVVPTERVRSAPKYADRMRRYLRALRAPRVRPDLDTADLSGAVVDRVCAHPTLRQADGTPLHRVSAAAARELLRRGRVLSRDAPLLHEALTALGEGAACVRFGTPESLRTHTATRVVADPAREDPR